MIGVDGRSLFSGQQTGVSRYLRNLLNHLPPLPGTLLITLYVDRTPSQGEESWKQVDIRPVSSRWFSQKRLWENLALPRALAQEGCSLYFSPAYVLPLRLPCPGVVTIHDISYEVHPEWFPPLRSRYIRHFARRSARKATRILTDSEFSRAEICRHYRISPEKVRAIPLAADPGFFERPGPEKVAAARRRYELPEEFGLYVGSIHQRRQIPEMIRAMGLARRARAIDHHLVLVGHNNFHPPISMDRLIADSGGEGFVRWIDFVPEADLRALYAAADFVTYISRYEGFGLPVIEAMAAGRPVVTARAASLPEVAGDAALLVDPQSVDDIADAYARLATDFGLREELAQRGSDRAQAFSWDRTARETLAVLSDCLNPPRNEREK